MWRSGWPSTAWAVVTRAVIIAVAGCVTCWPSPATAQFPQPRLDRLYPPAVQRGTVTELRAIGADLDGATTLWCENEGVRATPKYLPAAELREFPVAESGTFHVGVASDAAVGSYFARVVGRFGSSGHQRILVTDAPVMTASPSTDRTAPTEIETNTHQLARAAGTARQFYSVKLPAHTSWTVDVDCQSFDSEMTPCVTLFDPDGNEIAQQRSDARRRASIDIITRVEGSYTVAVFDAIFQGGDAYPYLLTVHDRPRVVAVLPHVIDQREDAVVEVIGYRLPPQKVPTISNTVDQRPTPDRPLPDPPLSTRGDAAATVPVSVTKTAGASSHQPLETALVSLTALDWKATPRTGSLAGAAPLRTQRLPVPIDIPDRLLPVVESERVYRESEINQTWEHAQQVEWPCHLTGVFAPRGDLDWYRFTAHKDDVIDIRVQSEPGTADPVLSLVALESGDDGVTHMKEIARVDDVDDPGRGGWHFGSVHNQSSNPRYRWQCTEDGDFALCVQDAYAASRGGPELAYHVTISQAKPTYRVAVLPSALQQDKRVHGASLNVRRGSAAAVAVRIERSEEATLPVVVWVTGLPPGMACTPSVAGPTQRDVSLIVSAADSTGPWSGQVSIWYAPLNDELSSDSLPRLEQLAAARHKPVLTPDDRALFGAPIRESEYLAVTLGTDNYQTTPPAVRRAGAFAVTVVADDQLPLRYTSTPDPLQSWSRDKPLTLPITMARPTYQGEVEFHIRGLSDQFELADHKSGGTDAAPRLKIKDGKQPAAGWYTFFLEGRFKAALRRDPRAVAVVEREAAFVQRKLEEDQKSLQEVTQQQPDLEAQVTKTRDALQAGEQELAAAREAHHSSTAKLHEALEQWKAVAGAESLDVAALQAALPAFQAAVAAATADAATLLEKQQATDAQRQQLETATQAQQQAQQRREQLDQSIATAQQALEETNKRLEAVKKANEPQDVEYIMAMPHISVYLQDAPTPTDGNTATGAAG